MKSLESATLRITKDGFFLESAGRIAAIKLNYSGVLEATLDGCIGGMNNKDIIVVFIEPAKSPFIKAEGRYKIIRGEAYSLDKKKIGLNIILEDDKVQNIKSEWNTSDTKYEDLDYAYDNKNIRRSRLTYFDGNKEVTVNDKGKRIRSK